MSNDRCPQHDCDIAVCFEEHQGGIMNEAFEKFEAVRLQVSIEEIRSALEHWAKFPPNQGKNSPKSVLDLDIQNEFAIWQAAEAHGREPQTVDTCKAVPPHSKGCLLERTCHEPGCGCGDIKGFCLVCEARDAALREAENIAFIVSQLDSENEDEDPALQIAYAIQRLREGLK